MTSFSNACHVFIATTLLVVIAASTVKGDDSPPFFGNICRDVQCGKGRCEADSSNPLNFKCDCDDGWKRTHTEIENDDHLEFLPCIIPNCTVNYSCMPAPPPVPPVPSPTTPFNASFYDPCNWMYCGEGTCTRNGTYGHTCQCKSGSSNLLNVPAFPCYPDCAVNSASCGRLGIRVSSSTAGGSNNSPSSSTSNPNSAMSLYDQGLLKSSGIAFILASLAVMF